MESHRILICLALFAACTLAVNGAAIETASDAPVNAAAESQPTEQKLVPAEPTSEEHARQKKWAYAYGYGLTYPAAPAAVAYSAYPGYYPAYRAAVPAYYPAPAPAYYI